MLKKSEVRWVEHLPNWNEFNTKRIWLSSKQRPEWPTINRYFPDFPGDSLPNKQYLVNVLNTVVPNLVMDTIKKIRQQKVTEEEDESPILMTQEYYEAL